MNSLLILVHNNNNNNKGTLITKIIIMCLLDYLFIKIPLHKMNSKTQQLIYIYSNNNNHPLNILHLEPLKINIDHTPFIE